MASSLASEAALVLVPLTQACAAQAGC